MIRPVVWFCWLVITSVMFLSCGSGDTGTSDPSKARKLVLLVHGYQGVPEHLRFYRDALRASLSASEWQVEAVTGLDPSYHVASLEGPDQNTRIVERFIADMAGKQINDMADRSLFFVGHSMGGLLARQFSVWHPAQTAKIFMLGTPNGGMNGLPSNSWAGSERMNHDAGPAWTSWNGRYRSQAEVEHYLFTGICSNPLVSLVEGSPNDGLVGAWSVGKLREFVEADTIIQERVLNDSHGVIPSTGCSATLLDDEVIAADIIANLRQGSW